MTANTLTPSEDKLLRLLPFYIEHKLLQQKLGKAKPWEPKRTNPTWQALCRHYSLCVKFEPAGANEEDVEAFRHWLASGTAPADYPTSWDVDDMKQLLDPQSVVLNFALDAAGWSKKPKAPEAELPLTGFTAHMKTKPSGLLTISMISGINDCPLVMLDDGLFKSADYIDMDIMAGETILVESNPAPIKILFNHPTLDANDVRQEIWRRWETGWECAEPPDIKTEDGKRFSGTDYITAIM